jgi:non-ribosomal peptide synthetase component F
MARRWSDRASWTLEERLPHLFREIEERIVMTKEAVEVQRIESEQVSEQARAFAEVQRLRSYISAMETAYGEHEETAPWLAWALQPHLPNGWSADGPHEGRWRFPTLDQRY